MHRKRITILSGAGISAESGISTFRDAGGLWEGHDVMEVASIEGWQKNPSLVLDFYNKRRRQLNEVEPNEAHILIAQLAKYHDMHVITQNVDDLHERAGSKHVIHLHGELRKSRSSIQETLVYECMGDILTGDLCELGSQLRPQIVWFGEMVPMLEIAAKIVSRSELLIIIGTSLQVYPAASLYEYAPDHIPVYYIDPNPGPLYGRNAGNIEIIRQKATEGMKTLYRILTKGMEGT